MVEQSSPQARARARMIRRLCAVVFCVFVFDPRDTFTVVIFGLVTAWIIDIYLRSRGTTTTPPAATTTAPSDAAAAPDPGVLGTPGSSPSEVDARLRELAWEASQEGERDFDEVVREASELVAHLPPAEQTRLLAAGFVAPTMPTTMPTTDDPAPPQSVEAEPVLPPAWEPPLQPRHDEVPVYGAEPAVDPGTPSTLGFDVVAPDVLTGNEPRLPEEVPEGWYRTADGSRERWFNGATWTAHERAPGTY